MMPDWSASKNHTRILDFRYVNHGTHYVINAFGKKKTHYVIKRSSTDKSMILLFKDTIFNFLMNGPHAHHLTFIQLVHV